MNTTVSPVAAERRRLRLLAGLGIAALLWVSYGSWSMIVWAGVNPYLAVAYPLIVDAGVVFTMPFYTDADLPDTKDWPIRSHARRTIVGTFGAILIFNALHTVIEAMPAEAFPAWVRPVIALIAGVVPPVLYVRSAALQTLVSSWGRHDAKNQERVARESRETEEREARESREAERRENEAYQREQERERVTHEAELARIRATADAEATVLQARESPRESRRESRPAPTAAPAITGVDPALVAIAEQCPEGGTKLERAVQLTELVWDAGLEPTSADLARVGGFDRKYAATAKAELAKRDVVPPSERAPKLTLATR